MNNNQIKKQGPSAVGSRGSQKNVGKSTLAKQGSSVSQSANGNPLANNQQSQQTKPQSRHSNMNGMNNMQNMQVIPFQDGNMQGGSGTIPSQMNSFYGGGGDNMMQGGVAGGERVRVAMRVRPMMPHEGNRGDENIITIPDTSHVLLSLKAGTKSFRFNAVLDESIKQSEVFNLCGVHELLDSSLEGYSATVFAYGQTGSGKTFTMSGIEDKLGREGWTSDENDGLFPRSVRYMWERMTMRHEQFYVKASFLEIYNEQLRDLLNPSSGILHCRWNVKNGFFVEDLMVVECTSQQDLIAVLHEGMKNRKSGSHELNKDSSRSHSILTVYLISETVNEEDGHVFKKYGKVSFVDLAGSERLKESKSVGEMLKETGQINKSLFTLGKVISMLSSEKSAQKLNQKYIPYRDSKLTMLLMDSLGGTSKALMIACVSPSHMWADETISTLNYATRTMNIKNKPVIQMDAKEQVIYNLKREIYLLKLENEYLKDQVYRLNGGKPIQLPTGLQLEQQYNQNGENTGGAGGGGSSGLILPPIGQHQSSFFANGGPPGGFPNQQQPQYQLGGAVGAPMDYQNQSMAGFRMLQEFEFEMQRLREENSQLRYQKELRERDFENVMFENNTLYGKLENLENVFIGSSIQRDGLSSSHSKMSQDYTTSTLLLENTELKKKIARLEEEKLELKQTLINIDRNGGGGGGGGGGPASTVLNGGIPDMNEVYQMKQSNEQLQKRVEFLQKRERELQDNLIKAKQRN